MTQLWEKTALFLGTGLGVGFIPFAPGTFGTLWGLPLVWGIHHFTPMAMSLQLACVVVIFLLGVPICQTAATALGLADPGSVVFDEVAAMPIVFLVTPLTWSTAILGFFWFRLFDIWKPWPASRLEQLHGGLGIMLDDAVAGIYAAVAMWLTVKLLGLEAAKSFY